MSEKEGNAAFLRDETVAPAQPETGTVEVTRVEDREVLFRKVFHKDPCYVVVKDVPDNGHYQIGRGATITSQAFADKKAEPSVDREDLCPTDPKHAWTQNGDEHGVLWMLTASVRQMDNVYLMDGKGKSIVQKYDVDVRHEPVSGQPGQRNNPAHSIVWTNPNCAEKSSAKKRLLEGLAKIADWKVLPADARAHK